MRGPTADELGEDVVVHNPGRWVMAAGCWLFAAGELAALVLVRPLGPVRLVLFAVGVVIFTYLGLRMSRSRVVLGPAALVSSSWNGRTRLGWSEVERFENEGSRGVSAVLGRGRRVTIAHFSLGPEGDAFVRDLERRRRHHSPGAV